MTSRKSSQKQIALTALDYANERGLPPAPTTPLTYRQVQLLNRIEAEPGLSRAELARLCYPEKNEFYSIKQMVKTIERLRRRGLVEFGVIREGGRASVQGLYLVGKPRPVKPGYLGVNGWVYPKERRA